MEKGCTWGWKREERGVKWRENGKRRGREYLNIWIFFKKYNKVLFSLRFKICPSGNHFLGSSSFFPHITWNFKELLQPPGQRKSGWCNSIHVQIPSRSAYTLSNPPDITHIMHWKEIASGYLEKLVWSTEPLAWPHQLRLLCWLFSGKLRTVSPSWLSCNCCGEGSFFLYPGMSLKQREGRRRDGGRPLGYLHGPVPSRSEKHCVTGPQWIINQQQDVKSSSHNRFPPTWTLIAASLLWS